MQILDHSCCKQVLKSFAKSSIVTWDTVLDAGQPWSLYDEWLQDKSHIANFLKQIGGLSTAKERDLPNEKWLVCDPLAVAVAINESLVLESKVSCIAFPKTC